MDEQDEQKAQGQKAQGEPGTGRQDSGASESGKQGAGGTWKSKLLDGAEETCTISADAAVLALTSVVGTILGADEARKHPSWGGTDEKAHEELLKAGKEILRGLGRDQEEIWGLLVSARSLRSKCTIDAMLSEILSAALSAGASGGRGFGGRF